MRPLLPYYGAKWRAARLYPKPTGLVVEPFAGGAGYSAWWEPDRAVLCDLDPIVVGIWDFLIHATYKDVMNLPMMFPGQKVADLKVPSQEARWFLSYWAGFASNGPRQTVTKRSPWSESTRKRTADSTYKLKNWKIAHLSYDAIPKPPQHATYFVDPPYMDKGRYYRYGSSGIDYEHLGMWCKAVPCAQMIVCENSGANWLPFEHLATIRNITNEGSEEVVWLRNQ